MGAFDGVATDRGSRWYDAGNGVLPPVDGWSRP